MPITLTKYQKVSYKWFGRVGEKRANEGLKEDLLSAHMEIRAGAYLSSIFLSTILGMLVSFCFFTFFVFLLLPLLHVQLDLGMTVVFLVLPLLIGVLIYFVMVSYPGSRAKSRGKKIDANLAYATNFISAMASAGVTPTEIFKSLSKQDIYGEIKEEAYPVRHFVEHKARSNSNKGYWENYCEFRKVKKVTAHQY
jgi:flagellar protein FlaJ